MSRLNVKMDMAEERLNDLEDQSEELPEKAPGKEEWERGIENRIKTITLCIVGSLRSKNKINKEKNIWWNTSPELEKECLHCKILSSAQQYQRQWGKPQLCVFSSQWHLGTSKLREHSESLQRERAGGPKRRRNHTGIRILDSSKEMSSKYWR